MSIILTLSSFYLFISLEFVNFVTNIFDMELRRQIATRYIQPLREGGSLPALAEADDGFKYVVKFRGAGHGPKALIAELIGGEVARALGFKVPELVFLDIPEEFGRTEPDAEVQDLLRASRGLNLGLHFLSSALALDPYSNSADALMASRIVWLDSYLTNVDRTYRNTNMLEWYREPWLIDHGAALYFQHSGTAPEKAALTPFPYIKDHLMLRNASRLDEVNAEFSKKLTPEKIDEIVDLIPDEWLESREDSPTLAEQRDVYRVFLKTRLENSQIFTDHAKQARASL